MQIGSLSLQNMGCGLRIGENRFATRSRIEPGSGEQQECQWCDQPFAGHVAGSFGHVGHRLAGGVATSSVRATQGHSAMTTEINRQVTAALAGYWPIIA